MTTRRSSIRAPVAPVRRSLRSRGLGRCIAAVSYGAEGDHVKRSTRAGLAAETGFAAAFLAINARAVSPGVERSGAGPVEPPAFQKTDVAKRARLVRSANVRHE